MLGKWTRVILDDNGTLKDFSLASQNSDTIALPWVAAQDKLYIGQEFPFNNFYLKLNTVNAATSSLSIELWDGDSWVSAVDILDETSVGGVTLSRSGVVQFSPDIDESWVRVPEPEEEEAAFVLNNTNIYNLYWLRISMSNDLSVGTILDNIGYRFATTKQLLGIDPEINDFLASWESGKTDWDDQLVLGSDHLIADLKARGMIDHAGNILRFDEFSFASAYRTLALIYSGLRGEEFSERRTLALENYNKLLSVKRFTLDKNNDAIVSTGEISNTVGKLTR